MQPKKTQIDINLENLPQGVHYSHILEFFKYNGIHTEPKQVYIKVRGPKKDKCTINWYNNYELAWKFVNLFGTKFSARWLNIELPDYEKSHKQRSNTFDEFWKEFDKKVQLENQHKQMYYEDQPQETYGAGYGHYVEEPAPVGFAQFLSFRSSLNIFSHLYAIENHQSTGRS